MLNKKLKWHFLCDNFLKYASIIGFVHFSVAVFAWLLLIYSALRMDNISKWTSVMIPFLSCIVMCCFFALSYALLIWHKKGAKILALVLVFVTVIWFFSDINNHDYQYQSSNGTSCQHMYLTWWWYNDSWDPNR